MDFEKIKFFVEEGFNKKIKESLEAEEELNVKLFGENPFTILLKNNIKTFLIIFMYLPDFISTKCETIVKNIPNLSLEECVRIKKIIEEYPLQEILDYLVKAQALWYCFLSTGNIKHSQENIDREIKNAMKYMGCLLSGVLLYNPYRISIILTRNELYSYLKSITLEDIVSHLAYYIWLDTGNDDSDKNYNASLGIFHNFLKSLDRISEKNKDILKNYIDNNRGTIDAFTFFELIAKKFN